MKVTAIALNTFREALRNRVLYSVVLFAAIIIAISAFFGTVTLGSQVKVIKDFGLFCLSFCGAIITILSGVNLLNKELRQKTIFNILSKPVARWQFILGKHLGLSMTVSLLVSLMGICLACFVAFFEQKFDWLLFQAILFTIFEVIIISAITILFSSIVVTTTLTGIFSLASYIAGRSISYLIVFVSEMETPDPIIMRIVSLLDFIVPDLSLFNFNDLIVEGHAISLNQACASLLYALSYSLVCLSLSSLIFSRREFT